MFTGINIYSINNKTDHISEKYIEIDIFPILDCIRIHIKMKRIRNNEKKIPKKYFSQKNRKNFNQKKSKLKV